MAHPYQLGMVLSGGGSRGLAHAGVLEALIEHGIEVDCISGASAGALVGALHAAGHRAAGILRFFERTTPFHFSHLAPFSRPGWLDTEKIEGDFREFFPADSFEALGKKLASQRKFHHVDLVLNPQPLESYRTLDPKRHEQILDIGYRAARERIDDIAALARLVG